MEEIKVDYLDKADSEKMICEPSGLVFVEGALDRICALTANSPFFNMLFMDGLVDFMKGKKSPYVSFADITTFLNEKLVKDTRFIIKRDFESLYDDELGDPPVSDDDNLGVLWAIAKQGNACPREQAGNTDQQLTSSVDVIISNLLKREILIEKGGVLSIKVSLFSEWLKKCEPSQIYANFRPRDQKLPPAHSMEAKNRTARNTGNESANPAKMAAKIVSLVDDINASSEINKKGIIFKKIEATTSATLSLECNDKPTFGSFILACYAIVFDATSNYDNATRNFTSRKGLPEQFKYDKFVKIVDALRLDTAHPEGEPGKNQMPLEKAREILTENPHPWQKPEDFKRAQREILRMFIDYLERLNNYVRNDETNH
jgi:hypothetical protein